MKMPFTMQFFAVNLSWGVEWDERMHKVTFFASLTNNVVFARGFIRHR